MYDLAHAQLTGTRRESGHTGPARAVRLPPPSPATAGTASAHHRYRRTSHTGLTKCRWPAFTWHGDDDADDPDGPHHANSHDRRFADRTPDAGREWRRAVWPLPARASARTRPSQRRTVDQ